MVAAYDIRFGSGITLGAGIKVGILAPSPLTSSLSSNDNNVIAALASNAGRYTGTYTDITAKSRPSTTHSFTIEGWMKWDTDATNLVGTLIGGLSDTTRQPHFLCIYANDNYWNGSQTVNASCIIVDGYFISQTIYPSPVQFQKNTWYHVAVSRDSTNNDVEAVWINGVRCGGTQNDNRVYSGNSLTISNGWPTPQNNKPFVGKQTDIRIVSNSYVYNPTSSTITVPTSPLTVISSDCIGLIQARTSGALAEDKSAVGQTLSYTGLARSSDSPYASGGTGSWQNIDGNGVMIMSPGVYNC